MGDYGKKATPHQPVVVLSKSGFNLNNQSVCWWMDLLDPAWLMDGHSIRLWISREEDVQASHFSFPTAHFIRLPIPEECDVVCYVLDWRIDRTMSWVSSALLPSGTQVGVNFECVGDFKSEIRFSSRSSLHFQFSHSGQSCLGCSCTRVELLHVLQTASFP